MSKKIRWLEKLYRTAVVTDTWAHPTGHSGAEKAFGGILDQGRDSGFAATSLWMPAALGWGTPLSTAATTSVPWGNSADSWAYDCFSLEEGIWVGSYCLHHRKQNKVIHDKFSTVIIRCILVVIIAVLTFLHIAYYCLMLYLFIAFFFSNSSSTRRQGFYIIS